ncbi:sigma-70 family RNA polymerase sigma factor [Fuscovulum ytuae]|uniref:sigma-70 family RNA polymerase sigma factor n=1 Tax=Fuscovulum ytuae TaxID=3042299 RepID=UPI003075D2E2
MMFDARQAEKTDAPSSAQQYAALEQRVSVRKEGPAVQTDQVETDWAALVLRVRDHQDKAAFAALFRHFAPRVKAFLMKSGADATTAEECAQDVMATLWQKAHLFDPSRASVATWVFTIARNRRIDALRKARRPEPEELPWGPEPEPDQAEVLEAQQDTERLGTALAQLPEKQRALIERAFYGDLSHSEIAAETGLPLGTIKSRIRLALERLRQQMS